MLICSLRPCHSWGDSLAALRLYPAANEQLLNSSTQRQVFDYLDLPFIMLMCFLHIGLVALVTDCLLTGVSGWIIGKLIGENWVESTRFRDIFRQLCESKSAHAISTSPCRAARLSSKLPVFCMMNVEWEREREKEHGREKALLSSV